ncbi:MAG: tRNA (adenosine(37)-N6)-threonylcarbamoyltransferase complex dimerization subunit type 1 TsaB [Sphingobium sp.]|uniref:tRNA (adenosine(37)-N6)-threonylcarbamoyltransferase complex dimerization subunit type 1 TsaB n=1 Tax=Sphingobium sp. TaxID=1912891 RepID=UPI0029BDBB5B|nr:tRNA (adenosine(37)-N6)-threonylcarbamoyltransferase complex dimerization subunit type 1 TsaB [Sphingobium sp.]MDX3910922.1 tRNA (adenosine(37)-N6)-threonylcarbamoyltransferase complex dimerization subunit type 1 TsaB [Sphingobium sp.]
MRILVIDTATQMLSLSLFDEAVCIAHHHERVGRGHAERLLPAIASFPGGGRADQVAVDVGPGSFTGVRIGLAAARALAFAWECEIAGYSALSVIATAVARDRSPAGDYPVAITGGHGELFWQMFSPTGTALSDLKSTPIATLANILNDEEIYGTGAQALVDARGTGTAVDLYPDSSLFPLLSSEAASLPVEPLYGREADAQPMTIPVPS